MLGSINLLEWLAKLRKRATWENGQSFKMLNIQLPCDPVIPLLGGNETNE